MCDALANLGDVDPSDVEASVSQTEVTLTGTVPHRHWKHTMEDVAEAVFGVKDVINRIRVKAPTEEDQATRNLDAKTGDVDSLALDPRHDANRMTHS